MIRNHRLAVPLAVCTATATALAQTWTLQSPTTSPSGRAGHCMAYDSVRNETVMFGGFANATGYRNDTWTWNGTIWVSRAVNIAPPARRGSAMVFDSSRARVVLFGGEVFQELGDTWEWNGNQWTQTSAGASPRARSRHAMAFDSGRGRTVLFGGQSLGIILGDTWEWDGATWLQRTPATAPLPTLDHAMAFDTVRGRTVMFGGITANGPTANTWEWDGQSWLLRVPTTSPPARQATAMVFDQQAQRTVIFSGDDGVFPFFDDLWTWNGTAWAQPSLQQRPVARTNHAMVYDSARQRIVLFGGDDFSQRDDTWQLDLATPLAASATAFGAGCAATTGAQPLTLAATSRPIFGTSVSLLVQHIPLAPAHVILGFSNTEFLGSPLPFPLVQTFPSCSLLVSIDGYTLAPTTAPGSAQITLSVPTATALRGLRVYCQAWAPATGPVLVPLVFSNGIELVIGS